MLPVACSAGCASAACSPGVEIRANQAPIRAKAFVQFMLLEWNDGVRGQVRLHREWRWATSGKWGDAIADSVAGASRTRRHSRGWTSLAPTYSAMRPLRPPLRRQPSYLSFTSCDVGPT